MSYCDKLSHVHLQKLTVSTGTRKVAGQAFYLFVPPQLSVFSGLCIYPQRRGAGRMSATVDDDEWSFVFVELSPTGDRHPLNGHLFVVDCVGRVNRHCGDLILDRLRHTQHRGSQRTLSLFAPLSQSAVSVVAVFWFAGRPSEREEA